MYDMHSSSVSGLDEREGLEWQVRARILGLYGWTTAVSRGRVELGRRSYPLRSENTERCVKSPLRRLFDFMNTDIE